MGEETNLLRYFLRSFQDQDQVSFKRKEGVHIPSEEFFLGELSSESLSLIKEKVEDSVEQAELHICPVFLERMDDPEEILTPLFIPAQLEEEKLLPVSHQPPYIPRRYLDPTTGGNPALGSLDTLNGFVERTPYTVDGNWKQAIRYAKELFLQVAGDRFENFTVDNYRLSMDVWVVVRQGGSRHKTLISLFEGMIASPPLPPLLKNYLTLKEKEKQPLLDSADHSDRHLGQMNDSYPLSPGQRESLHHFFTLDEGEMLAINGPPGTGKTTLLQNVVASLWVKAAAEGAEDPPVIVATSANNKAITNIIDSFAKAGNEELEGVTVGGRKVDGLQGRWIPDLQSFGLYLPSNSKMDELRKGPHDYQIVSEKGENFMQDLEAVGRHNELKAHFLNKCSDYAGYSVEKIEQAVDLLQRELLKTRKAIRDGVGLAVKHGEYQRILKENYEGSKDRLLQQKTEWKQKVERVEEDRKPFLDLKRAWNEYRNREPFWWGWLAFLPGIKERRRRRIENFILENQHLIQISSCVENQVTDAIDRELKKYEQVKQEATVRFRELEALHGEMKATQRQLQDWCASQGIKEEDVIAALDTSLRYLAFMLATHYWEGKWILEVEEQIQHRYRESKSSRKTMKKWRRYAKLTPCFVSTFYKLPDWFCGYDPVKDESRLGTERVFLTGFIDLLIIDEAGQVPPGLAAPAFALAKSALVVGDTMQIEPIAPLTREVDLGNLIGNGVIQDLKEVDNVEETGVTATSGSVMRIAQRRSKYRKVEPFGGMFLAEHRRCVPEIIEYCNLLAYDGSLIPKRKPKKKKYDFLPHLGYADIGGEVSEANGRGKFNLKEAEAVALWIRDHASRIEKISGKRIDEVLGVVTPFRYQTALIHQFLKELGLKDITVGTVHALQGAEKDIILFSPVDGSKKGKPFYDRNPNMLNVAVSRARDSFLVFGDMGEFGTIPGTPSYLLKELFFEKKNEIQSLPKENQLLEKVAMRLRKRTDSREGHDRAIIQHIVHIHKNEGQVTFTHNYSNDSQGAKQVSNNQFHVHNNPGQINAGDYQQVTQNIYGTDPEWSQLKYEIKQLMKELKVSSLEERLKKDSSRLLEEAVDQIEENKVEKSFFHRLNHKLTEMKGLVSGTSTLSESISTVVNLLGVFLK